jgi:hypothetical protein
LSDPIPESVLEIDQLLNILAQVDPASPLFQQALQILDTRLVRTETPKMPASTPPGAPRKLTIGMATYDDFDGVYFSVQAIRLYHPEITADTEILVIDNNPTSPAAAALKSLEGSVDGYRYVPAPFVQGTAVRDLIFREASGEFVLSMDSHVLFPAGALAQLLEYMVCTPGSRDLLQGALLFDDLKNISTHFDPVWQKGMWGVWGKDQRGSDPTSPPFEIPMQGLGVFACRRDAWPGFNPRLHGFGGEEGYIHEKFRRRGARTLCLPFLRWIHRFGRPLGVPYSLKWEDRIRNYMILFDELGMDRSAMIEHFEEFLGVERVRAIAETVEKELANPFYFFEGIYCINLDRETKRWQAAMNRFEKLGIAGRVRRFSAIETPSNHHIGCALSHRAILAEARQRGLRNVLVFEDDVIFSPNAIEELRPNVVKLKNHDWQTLYLGGHRWGRTFEKAPGCQHLEIPQGVTCTHAIAYRDSIYDRILAEVPQTPSRVALWLRKERGIDQYFMRSLAGLHLITSPIVATQGSILAQETRDFEERT